MRFQGKIKELNQIIVSDPSYGEKVTCRYERTNINGHNWNVNIEINNFSKKIDNIQLNGIEFFILLNNPNSPTYLHENGSYRYQPDNKIEEIMIGMDTACIALGINNYANDIRDSKGDWQPDNSLNTLTDGIFGYVKEGTKDNTINFIWISGFLSEDTEYSIEDIMNYLSTYLEITDLYKEISGIKFPIVKNDKDITDDIF